MEATGNCWKQIGVWSTEKPSCPKLPDVIHCYNCDVFIQAGRNLLERELPEAYKNEWTDVMAAEKEVELFSTVSVVIFRIEEEWLAIRTQVFAEVIDPERLHSHTLPHRNNPVLIGIINIRGEINLCVSLKELLGIERRPGMYAPEPDRKKNSRKVSNRMIVIDNNGEKWVFPVNGIHGIHRVHPSKFQNVPVTVVKAQSTFTKGIFKWEKKHVAFLDDDLLFFSLSRSVQ
ncbi:MAG: chemotaxis protein CheW [Desulfobacteraceae bacterium]|nr:chemotaxis protein CheW [Desulfobacteraceae bacterium]